MQLNTGASDKIQEMYKVHPSLDTLLMFNEDSNRPVASISMNDIPTQTLNNVVSANQYLALPRLSSQDLLDGICPTEWNRPRKRLCVILVTENTDAHDEARDALRKIALESAFSADRVRFAYIYQDRQAEFVNALSNGSEDTLLRLVVIWRRDTSHIKYEWVSGIHMHIKHLENETNEQSFNATKRKLDESIQRLLRTSESLSYEAEVKVKRDFHTHTRIHKLYLLLYCQVRFFCASNHSFLFFSFLYRICSMNMLRAFLCKFSINYCYCLSILVIIWDVSMYYPYCRYLVRLDLLLRSDIYWHI